jgi:hypothetical protein
MTRIQKAAQGLIDKYGSVRKAGSASGIHYSLLWKIASGAHDNLTTNTLAKLGLEVRRTYVRKLNGAP